MSPTIRRVLSQTSVRDSIQEQQLLKKIRFDVNAIDEKGMIGPTDGKRNMDYEFCISLDKKKKKEVSRIDPSVKFFFRPGRAKRLSREIPLHRKWR